MEIEVVEYYPNEKQNKNARLLGTMHVYVCNKNMDIKGIKIYKGGKDYFVKLPGSKGKDQESLKDVYYPYMSFCGDEQDDFITSLRKEAKKFMVNLKNEKKKKKGK